MKRRGHSLSCLIIGSVATVATASTAWTLAERTWFAHGDMSTPLYVALLKCAIAPLLVLACALVVLRRRLREGEGTESKFQSLVESAPDALFIMDDSSRLVVVNGQMEKLFGYSREELIGQPVESLIHKQARDAKSDAFLDLSRPSTDTSQTSSVADTTARRKDGSEFPVETIFSPLETKDGSFVLGILRDVSERLHRERRRAVRHAVRRVLAEAGSLREATPTLLETSCDGLGWHRAALWLVDPRTEQPYCFGIWPAPLPNGTECEPADVGHVSNEPHSPSPFAPGIALAVQVLQSRGPVWISDLDEGAESMPSQPAGERRHAAMAIPIGFGSEIFGVIAWYRTDSCEPNEDLVETMGMIGSQVGHFLERKRGEEAVFESEARKAAILEAALDAVITVDAEGRILELNPAAKRMFGYARSEATGKLMAELMMAPGTRDQFRQNLAKYLGTVESPPPGERLELSALRADGSEFPVELTVTRIRSDGRPAMATTFVRDISELKQTEAALRRTEEQFRQSQKMEAIGHLAGGVAHDFNNLLTIISGYGEMVTGMLRDDDPARPLVQEISTAADRAARLTRQLLAFSRKQILTPKVLDLNTLVIEMNKMLERLIGEDIQLRTALAPTLDSVKVDPGQIEQVIMNLAVNARDAMPKGGKLTIETGRTELNETYTRAYPELVPGPYVLLAISDNGCGMDRAVRERIFEPFFTTKEVGKGTGLGLATVYGIVKQSGGHIAVYSEPGQGTTFKIYLPCAGEELQPNPATQVRPEPATGKETVLLVEDEDGVRKLTRRVLQKNGYRVLEARGPGEALKLCEQHGTPVDIMVTDVVMPELSGPQLARRLLRRRPDLKVLFLSGYSDNALLHNGVVDTAKNFLQKPFTPDTLATKVREVLAA